MNRKPPHTDGAARALTAREFFALDLPGCNRTDAMRATGIAYQTIYQISSGHHNATTDKLQRLEAWSLARPEAVAKGVWLSGAKTAGLSMNVLRTNSQG